MKVETFVIAGTQGIEFFGCFICGIHFNKFGKCIFIRHIISFDDTNKNSWIKLASGSGHQNNCDQSKSYSSPLRALYFFFQN